MDYKKYDIFSPMAFVLLVIVYLIFSEIAFHYHLNELIGVDLYTIGLIFLGIAFYSLGIVLSNYFLKNKEISINTKKIDKLEINRTVFIITNIYNSFLFEYRTDPHIISIDEYNQLNKESLYSSDVKTATQQ